MVNKDDTELKRKMPDRAFISLVKTLICMLTGRLPLNKRRISELIKMGDGQEYHVFRQVIVDPGRGKPAKPGAILRILFNFVHGTPKQDQRLSLIPIPFIVVLPGFRSKTWAIKKDSGGFQGIYEWETIRDAEVYKQSFAIKLMTKRVVPGTVTFKITPSI